MPTSRQISRLFNNAHYIGGSGSYGHGARGGLFGNVSELSFSAHSPICGDWVACLAGESALGPARVHFFR